MNELQGSDSGAAALDTAKLIIYVMTSSIMKINPQYFSIESLAAIGRNEVQLLKNLSGECFRRVNFAGNIPQTHPLAFN